VVHIDVPPPFWEPTHVTCGGAGRRCAGGDSACREKAQADGYTVRVGNYHLCRPADARVELRPAGWIFVAILAIAIGTGVFLVARRLRKRARVRY
jgi:hypothetical protein